MNLAKLARAQSTLLHWMGFRALKTYGYFIPYRYANDLAVPDENTLNQPLKDTLDQQHSLFKTWLNSALKYADHFAQWHSEDPSNVNRPRFNQDWFPGLDGAMAYTFVRELRPNYILEIGSGHSTRFMAQAKKDGELTTHIHSIDPVPRREIDSLCSEITRSTVTDLPLSTFHRLKAKDILFIDGSHIGMPGTDVDYLFSQVLPYLPSGVIIHVHDIFLPWGYPKSWHWRSYNEQIVLAAMLGLNLRYEILCPNYYLRRQYPELVNSLALPLLPGAVETSIWLRVK